MVGGVVIETIRLPERVWVNVRDRVYERETCAIYVERTVDADSIEIGDSLWWQGREAYWTPKAGGFEDRAIPRIGYSGVERPR